MYLLQNGLVLYQSSKERDINRAYVNTIASTEVNTDGYYYIHNYDTDKWYEYRLPLPTYPDTDLTFLFDAFWNGPAVFVGRYVVPLEDVIILIDGTDFDGVQQNKAYTAGFMIVGVIPGGKIMKPITKVAKNSDVALAGWKVIAKVGDDTVNLSFKIVNGIVEFGSRSKLASIIKTSSLEEAHHIIPWNKLGDDVVQEAAYAGFHMNANVNGRALKKFTSLTGEGIHGNHPAYDKFVQKRFDDFKDDNILTPENTLEFLNDSLIPELNILIDDAIDSGMNLNTYFGDIINPLNGII